MLPITQKFTNCTISPRGGTKIQWIVMHYFGGLSTALECAGWFCNPSNNSGSADFCVDDTHIVQVNPDLDKYNTWHCGGGLQGSIRHSKYGICKNSNSIGIEMRPYNDRGAVSAAQNAGWYFHQKTVDNAVDLVKYLMSKYNIDADHVIMHADVTGKYCPAPWLDRPAEWDAFQAAIRGNSSSGNTSAGQPTTSEMYRVRKTWTDAASQIGAFTVLDNAKKMADQTPGYIVFNSSGKAVYTPQSGADTPSTPAKEQLAVDGSFGPATVRRTQEFLGVTVDGIVSNQPMSNKKYLSAAYAGYWEFKTSGYAAGSNMVRALQAFLGLTQDGWCGKVTIMTLQKLLTNLRYYAGAIDGSMGPETVKAWQRYLNEH